MDEIASLKPMFAGVNYQRMEGYNLDYAQKSAARRI
jgi:predicted molibdopterin-dependent oxidoreductase YjgC